MLLNIEFLPFIIIIIYICFFFIQSYWFIFELFIIYFITKIINISLNPTKFSFNTYYYILNSLLDTKIFLLYVILGLIIIMFFKKMNISFITSFILIYFFYCLVNLGLFKYKICFYKYIITASILANNDYTSELLNGLFFLHPIFFFLITLFIYTLILIKFHENFNFLFAKNSNICYSNITVKFDIIIFIILIILLSVISGAWWAQQELNWNGWWSWDNIELINFLELLILIIIIHQISYFNQNMTKLNLFIFFFLIILISLRFNLIITRHTFLINVNELQFSIYGFVSINYILYLIYFSKNIMNFNNIKESKNYIFNIAQFKFSFILIKKMNFNYMFFLYSYIIIYVYVNFIVYFKYILYILHYLFDVASYMALYVNLLIFFFLSNISIKSTLVKVNKNKIIFYQGFLFITNLLNFFKQFKFFKKTTFLYKHQFFYIIIFHIILFQLVLSLIVIKLVNFIYTPLFLLDFLLYSELTVNNIISNFKITTFYINLNFNKKINFNTPLIFLSKNKFNIVFLNQDIGFLQYHNSLIGLFNHIQEYQSIHNNIIVLLHSTGLNTFFKDLWLLLIKVILLFILYFSCKFLLNSIV